MTKIRVRETLAEARVSSACYFGRQLVYISMIRRDSMKMNSINSSILLGSPLMLYKDNGSYQLLQGSKQLSAMVFRLKLGKDSFIHSVVYPNNNRMDNVFMYRTEDYHEKLYAKLMERYDLPLLKEWIVQLDDVLKRRNLIRTSDIEVYEDIDNHLAGTAFCLIEEGLTQKVFDDILSSLIRFSNIKLLEPQEIANYEPLEFNSIDDFYIKYGEQILGDVIGKIKPIIEEPKTYLENVVLKEKTLFPPQAYVANGASRTLDRYKSVFMLETMGAGKTLQSFAVAEDYHVRKFLRRHPKATREEAIENVKYRIIVMSPGHILEKWKKEIEREIPYSQVEILDSFEKVLSLSKERGIEPKGKCFYIISKDFSKLGYVSYPLVRKSSKRLEKYYQCRICGSESTSHESVCHRCSGQMEVRFDGLREGAICPHCNTVLKTNDGPMELSDFENRTSGNSHCRTCGEELWGPLVQKETLDKIPWKKYKMYRNASQKGTKTVWVHDDLVHVYSYESEGLFVESKVNPIRKYPPSLFIRKKLGKNFFNACIIDEAHQYKSGSSAQGNAMFDIVKSSRKVIALTGTIAGGYANDVFYLFWRTKSWLMKKMGWDYDDVISFAERYGTLEKKFQKGEERYNEMSRGRAIGSPRVKPGISPLIYTDYMFEDTVYLDIGDLSSFMPNYYEYIRLVELDDETEAVYKTLKDDFMAVIKDKDGGHKLASSMLQTLLSYPDKPYGYKSLLHPERGEEAVYIPDCELLDGETLNKEEELLEIIEKELEEDRPCFVYCEFTGSGEKNVTGRLKKLIEQQFGLYNEVAILDSSGPSSREREAYIHKKASEGVKVFITNPRLTETGCALVSA